MTTKSKADEDLYIELDLILEASIDDEILKDLEKYLDIVKEKSRALSSSLRRCFKNAKKSFRYVEAYKIGQADSSKRIADSGKRVADSNEDLNKYIEKELKVFFEENDFMHYREFVRLLRACTIDVGGDISYEIKLMYKNYFSGKRLLEAYKLGIADSGERIAVSG